MEQKTENLIQNHFLPILFYFLFAVYCFVPAVFSEPAQAAIAATPAVESSDCLLCHEKTTVFAPGHKGLDCTKCHKDITELPHPKPLSKVDCSLCHEGIMGSFKEDPHARARKKGNLKAPDCKTCHSTHESVPENIKKLGMRPQNLDAFCATCHAKISAPKEYHVPAFASSECLQCHGQKEGKAPYVEMNKLKESVHKGHECTDCHRGINKLRHSSQKDIVPITEADCGMCHKKEFLEHQTSIHGKALKQGIPAAQCWDCHGKHDIFWTFDSRSLVNYKNLANTCATCHGKPELAEKYNIPVKNPAALYNESIHHKRVMAGVHGAVCSDCHGIHNIQPHTSPLSTINKANVPKTCSKCHENIYEVFVKSIHWRSYRKGVSESPVCIDCHSEHRILSPKDPRSPVYALNVPKTCSDCHERVRIVEKYGIPAMRMTSYLSSYHGLASKAGNIEAANCVSCHDTHNILPSSDPEATTNKNNLPKTCGHCHVGIAAGGQIDSIHEYVNKQVEFFTQLVTLIYLLLIGFTVGGMAVYCSLDFIKKARYRDSWISIYTDAEQVPNLKFNTLERILHQFLLIFFIILVYTGFAHHFPENPIFSFFVKLKGGAIRAMTHRIAGTGLIVLFSAQINLMLFTKRGRKQTKALFPKFNDAKEAIALLLYNFGFLKQRPHLTHPFSFIEKFEFWALIWGNIIMAGTGLLLWFTDISLSFIPKWILDIFLLIHYYEAILASLAILIWHLYWSIFDPVVYPYNPIIFTSKVPKELGGEKKHE